MPCASSHFKANATACVACPDGFVQAENNASTCERCPVGQYWVRGEGCLPCDLGKGVPCEEDLFRDDCSRQLEQGQPCACACRLCPLVAEALEDNEEIRDCAVQCKPGFYRWGEKKACVRLERGALGEYFMTARNTSDVRLYRCRDVLEVEPGAGYSFAGGIGGKPLPATVLYAFVRPQWRGDMGLELCMVRCVGGGKSMELRQVSPGGLWGFGCEG